MKIQIIMKVPIVLKKTFKNIFCNSELTYKGKMPFHKKNQINFKISKKFLEMNKWWLD